MRPDYSSAGKEVYRILVFVLLNVVEEVGVYGDLLEHEKNDIKIICNGLLAAIIDRYEFRVAPFSKLLLYSI
jgi:hypothetical protein